MLPDAISIGISYHDFWGKTNPHILDLTFNGYIKSMERQRDYDNELAYLQGMYFAEAIQATIGNVFKRKTAKNHEYPKEPYNLHGERELTEEEKDVQRMAFLDSLKQMQANFEASHKGD